MAIIMAKMYNSSVPWMITICYLHSLTFPSVFGILTASSYYKALLSGGECPEIEIVVSYVKIG